MIPGITNISTGTATVGIKANSFIIGINKKEPLSNRIAALLIAN